MIVITLPRNGQKHKKGIIYIFSAVNSNCSAGFNDPEKNDLMIIRKLKLRQMKTFHNILNLEQFLHQIIKKPKQRRKKNNNSFLN